MATNFPTTGTMEGDIKAGYIKNGVYQPTIQPSPQGGGSLQGTMTTPQPVSTPTPTVPTQSQQGSNPMAFATAMQQFQQGYQRDNQLMQQRNLLLRAVHGPVLSEQEKAQLSPEYRSLVDTGNMDQLNMNIRLLGDQAVGATRSIDSSLNFLVSTYQREQDRIEQQKKDSYNTILQYSKELGQKPSVIARALGFDFGDKLDSLMAPISDNTQVIQLSDGRDVLIDKRTGNIVKVIGGGSGSGVGTGGGDDSVTESTRQADLDLVNTLDNLQTHKGLNNAVGPNFFKWFTRAATPGGSKQSFIGDVQNIVDNLSLNKLIQAKSEGATFGALSDNELRMLGSSATKIGTWTKKNDKGEVVGYNISEKAFKDEVDRIKALTKRAYILSGYDPGEVGTQMTADGSVWMRGHDGQLIEVYRP